MEPTTTIAAGGAIAGALSIPAKALIEKVSGALGVLYEPTRIKRAANANAEAEKIAAISRFEISEMEERGLLRMVREQGRTQANIESITEQASEILSADSRPEDIEDDWVSQFFERCKLVSEPEMQKLWAQLLAGEAKSKNSISKRTIELVSTLERNDAELFTSLCQFNWYVNGDTKRVPLVTNYELPIYNKHGITYASLSHLESLGLIKFSTFSFNVTFPQDFTVVAYLNVPYRITSAAAPLKLSTGTVSLTKSGYQLSRVIKQTALEDFAAIALDHWMRGGLSVACLTPAYMDDNDDIRINP